MVSDAASRQKFGTALVEEAVNQALTPVSDPVSRTEIVASRIRAAILQGQLRPGEALVERDLAQMLGVSKTPIREALQALSNTGLVTFTPFKGTAVRVVDQELAWSIYEVRLLLEPEAVRLSTPNFRTINREVAGTALDSATRASAQGDFAALSMANRRFHQLISSDCANPVLLSFLNQVQDLVALISIEGWRLESESGRLERWKREHAQHAQVFESICAGRADEAAERVRAHVMESLQRLLKVIPGAPPA